MRTGIIVLLALASLASLSLISARTPAAQLHKRDYLTDEEADKIRDADTPAARIKLYVSFADDRLKKFDYELNVTTDDDRRRREMLNSLLNEYAGCIDDGADQIEVAKEKQSDIHASLKLMHSKYDEFLDQLQKYEKGGKDLDIYKDTLDDAVDATKDAISDVADAEKEMLPAPVRRKQSGP